MSTSKVTISNPVLFERIVKLNRKIPGFGHYNADAALFRNSTFRIVKDELEFTLNELIAKSMDQLGNTNKELQDMHHQLKGFTDINQITTEYLHQILKYLK